MYIDNWPICVLWRVFEITAGPLPQDRQLPVMTSSFLCPPVHGTGSLRQKSLPTLSNIHLSCWSQHN